MGYCKVATLYTRVSAYYNWILNMTKNATYCQNPFWSKTDEEKTTETTILTTTQLSTTVSTSAQEEESLLNDDPTANSNALNIQNFVYLNLFTVIIAQLVFSIFSKCHFPTIKVKYR